MNHELERAIRWRIERALERLSVDPGLEPRRAEVEIRARFLESWRDFERFGVESKAALDSLRVRIHRKATRAGEVVDVHVDVVGTPLEVKRASS